MSHCPTILGAGEMPTPNFPGVSPPLAPSGSKRGVVVLMHGINDGFPAPFADLLLPFGASCFYGMLAENLQQDGWVVVWPQEIGDNYVTGQAAGWFNDCNQDTGKGSRILGNIGRVTDHALDYCGVTYPGCPVVFGGFSLGAFLALQTTITKTSDLAGYFCHCPASLIWSANITPSFNVTPTTWALDATMNGLTLPQSTIKANASIGTPPEGTAGCLSIAASPNTQIVRYTGVSGQNFTGCTGGDGSSTLATGGQISQSTFTQGMDVAMNALSGLGNGSQGTPPVGYICAETGDAAVGFANASLIASNASPAVTYRQVSGGGHAMSKQDVAAICAVPWVSGGTYVLNSFVISSSVCYHCKLAVSGSSTAPASDTTHWETFGGDAFGPSPTTSGWFHTVMDPLCPAVH